MPAKQITLNMALAVDSISFDAVRVALNLVANMQRLEMTARFFIQRLEQSGISEQRRQTVSKIDYQALREAAEAIKVVATPQKLLAFRMKVTPQVVLALLDEREAKDKVWSAQDNHINQQADRIESLEKKNGDLGRALEAAEKRIAELEAKIDSADKLQDSAFRHGLQHGFSFGQTDNQAGFEECLSAYGARGKDNG